MNSVLGKNWTSREIEEYFVVSAVARYGISEVLARILAGMNINIEDIELFLEPKVKHLLPDPFHLKDMDVACEIASSAVINNIKIAVFGDYDVDGATSSALLKLVFRSLGKEIEIYIPDRLEEGYGPSIISMDKFKEMGAEVVFTVDCGSLAFEPLKYAKSIGLKVIVLDHHQTDFSLPEAAAVVNPNRLDNDSNSTNLAAVGVTFLFAVGLISKLKEKEYFTSPDKIPNLLNFLDLVALGTVCDMMQLTGLNRAFVKQGLKVMSKRQNLGLRVMSDLTKIDSKPSCQHLGFLIGPRINAGGRVGKSHLGANLLSTDNESDAYSFAHQLEVFNEERKIIEQKVYIEAMDQAKLQENSNMVMIASDNWHQGVIGITAGKIKELIQKPVAVISLDGEFGKASCRSVSGVDIGLFITKAKSENLLINGGGHAMAAGFTVRREQISALHEYFNNLLESNISNTKQDTTKFYNIEVSPKGVNLDLAREILKLDPFGCGNPEPIIKVKSLYVLKAQVYGRHINCLLAPDKNSFGSQAIRAVAFNSAEQPVGDILLSPKAQRINVYGNLKINNWQQKDNVQFVIHDIEQAE